MTKPKRCESCGHVTSALALRTVDAPTPRLRELGHQAGIAPVRLWLCDDAQACIRRGFRA